MPQPLDPLTWLGITAAITAAYTAAVILSGRRVEAEAAAEEEAVEEPQLPPIETLAEPPPPTPKPVSCKPTSFVAFLTHHAFPFWKHCRMGRSL